MDALNDSSRLSLLREIYNSTFDYAIFTTDLEGRVTTWNVGAERIMGFSSDEIIGQSHALIFTPEDRQRDEPGQEMQIVQATRRAEDYRWHMRKDGSRFWADGVLTAVHDESGRHTGYLKILRDITDRKEAETKVHRLANCDMLTGLANRHAFEMHAIESIAIASRSGQSLALHLIDLDRFKQVNDSLGHHAGDEVLQQAAQRMRNVLRDSDFIARLGGDEFVVLQPNMPSMQAGADLASKVITVLSQPFVVDGREVEISGSIGIAVCPDDVCDLDQLMKKADLALYRAKADGKGRYHYFTVQLDKTAHARSHEIAELRGAVQRKEFWVEYQPKVAFSNGQTVGLEALLRCSNPLFATWPVEDVVNLAIEAGLMKSLSFWVLREACVQMRKWKDDGIDNLKMCVNLCSQDLTDRATPGYIEALIAETRLQPADLEIELTERQALDVEKHGLEILQALRSRGISIALDDFGTGYSALSYLRNLPVTAVKLDKSFLIGIPDDPQGCTVVKAIMDLSRALGLEVVAEGVETAGQAAFLKEYDCTSLQGFLISHSLRAEDMTAWLLDGAGRVH
jgi:diguanylate cyclase (GGDEF)-like protein/PAS domain S-box-containing protein